ncbi:glycosyltransferase family 8 protein [Cognatiyoonia sp. IB215182]|uniref:glycosyltransferase family 8 protein n=1 Tax=Cognatiyoonia sp. IB215182 TaxID=3097353 RepID=UPI002A17BC94|nr:glycosyltransferase family 8 protein [Cognatiyoonia sp. IB215182]MDX8354495.1 glycosyltransferase family 8 protein [Cognatiyoonia sp. IB215182]
MNMSPSVVASHPALHKNAIVFCADENYFPYALFAAEQLRRTVTDTDFDIVICAPGGMKVPDPLTYLDIRLAEIRTNGLFNGLYLDERRTEAVYHRLVLPEVFSQDYERILYLDSDIFVHGGEFARLFNADLQGHAIAAVRDNYQWFNLKRQMPDFAKMGLKPAKYFNSGVILMDVAAYDDRGILERCVSFGRTHKDRLNQHDQELLNCVLHGAWTELSPVWNWQQPIRSAYYEVMLPVVITHFIGPTKPWHDPAGLVPPRFDIPLRAFLSRHFPDKQMRPVIRSADMSTSYVRKLTFKNVIRASKLGHYVRRFPDDLLAND